MSQFVTRTPLSSMRPLGSEAERSQARVAAVLARHVSTAHARLLADPVPVRDGTGIDWYVDDDGEVIALSALSPDEAAALKARLAAMIAEVRASADGIEQAGQPAQRHIPAVLRHAVTFPDEQNIWALRRPDGLQPLLVAWGYEPHSAAPAAPFNVATFARPREDATEPVQDPDGSTPRIIRPARTDRATAKAAVVLAPERWSGWPFALLLSGLAALLFALIVALLLPACGLRTPFGTIVFGFQGAACGEMTADGDVRRMALGLERELQVLREEALRRQRTCPIAPSAATSEAGLPAFEDVIDERGEYQVTLLWDTPDDLDLHVVCPDGRRIYHGEIGKMLCGGVLDEDANRGDTRRNPPLENVTFPAGPEGSGPFRVEVVRYNKNSDLPTVPYRIRIRTPSGTRELAGTTIAVGAPQPVTTMAREP